MGKAASQNDEDDGEEIRLVPKKKPEDKTVTRIAPSDDQPKPSAPAKKPLI